ncbi:MAG TPA: FtsX-like permease family protein [Vicinamibacterales bacterium]
MRPLDRKLARDIWSLKGQALAISLVIAAGVAMFVMYLNVFQSLRLTQQAYYERYRFGDVFAGLTRAPLGLIDRVRAIPGVARAEARVVVDVNLDVPGLTEPATARLIGIDLPAHPSLNDVFLRKGRFPAFDASDEVLVSEAFAEARGLNPGDRVGATINGRRRDLDIVGIALSPEYVYSIRPAELVPDDARFGVFWMHGRDLAAAFDMEGGFNNISLTLLPGASEADVIARLDRLLEIYGGLGAIPRSLQTSHWYLDNELRQLQSVGLILPIVFLIVAAFLLNVVLTRIVSVQREQIAALKALGYMNRELGWHYTKLSLVIGAAGAVIGTAGGVWMGRGMITIYNNFFRFPSLEFHVAPDIVAWGVIVSFAAASLGALNAVRRAVSLPPAEAMRPEPPARYRHSLLERAGLARWLSAPVRMILRNLGRHPVRTATSVIGIAASIAMLILGTFFMDSIGVLMDTQFFSIQRQDATVSFVLPASSRALHELRRLPGVLHVEPMRAVPARIRAAQRSRIVSIQGLVPRPELNRIVDVHGGVLALPPDGLVLSLKLAEVLGATIGDVVVVDVLDGRRPTRYVRVTGIVEEYMGTAAYMDIDALRRLADEGSSLSGAFLRVDSKQVDALYRRLKDTPMVAGVSLKRSAIESFQNTLADTFYVMIFFNLLFSSIIAGGVVYNAARVSLSERSRELASLRVLGFTRGEISFILLGELASVTLMAIPVGLIAGYLCAGIMVTAFETELYRFPLVVSVRTFAYAACSVLVAAAVSGLAVRRQLDHLDLVAVLKTRE